MKSFLDANVILAAVLGEHSAHSLAEAYANLTKLEFARIPGRGDRKEAYRKLAHRGTCGRAAIR